jgi:ElaB/YqjD/DUF883 family membrane-anchored ribosome-binding protein
MAEKTEQPSAEIADLRARMDQLADPVAPAVANAKDQAKQYVQQAQSQATDQVDQAAQMIRQSPVAAVLIACGAGYLFGRIVR